MRLRYASTIFFATDSPSHSMPLFRRTLEARENLFALGGEDEHPKLCAEKSIS